MHIVMCCLVWHALPVENIRMKCEKELKSVLLYLGAELDDGSPASEDDVALCLVSKQITVHQLPRVLVLHVKRFTITYDGVFKDSRHISFPFKLNMAPYCTTKCLEVCLSEKV